jgi:hypothetical protein
MSEGILDLTGDPLSFRPGPTLQEQQGWRGSHDSTSERKCTTHFGNKTDLSACCGNHSFPREEESQRLTWNGGCDCWLNGVGLLHKGLDTADKWVTRVKNHGCNTGYCPGLAL